jgi:hypothetical protein
MPPATNTGTSRRLGRISCASTLVETGPMCPPASAPSITIASAPLLTRRRAMASAGAKQITLGPASLMRAIERDDGMPPASTTWLTLRAVQASMSWSSSGCMMIRLTPNGLSVSAKVPSISAPNCAGDIDPQAMTPNPPPFDNAATR